MNSQNIFCGVTKILPHASEYGGVQLSHWAKPNNVRICRLTWRWVSGMKYRHTIKLFALLILCGCSSSPYFVELDPRSKSVNSSEYGEGAYFYHYSNFIFPSMNDAKAKEEYFNFCKQKLMKNWIKRVLAQSSKIRCRTTTKAATSVYW
jgi:hypothetical protein